MLTLGPKHMTLVDQVERMLQYQGIAATVVKLSLLYR